MSLFFGMLVFAALFLLVFCAVEQISARKNRSFHKWFWPSLMVPALPLLLSFLPRVPKAEAAETSSEAGDSETVDAKPDKVPENQAQSPQSARKFSVRFVEYFALFLIILFELFGVWTLGNWLSRPWGTVPPIVYDERLLAKKFPAQTIDSAEAFLSAFFRPEMTGEPISMPPFKEGKIQEHCVSLCGYSGVCDQIKLVRCMQHYRRDYEAVSFYLKRNYAYPWTKNLVHARAQENDREGVLDYGRLAEQLTEDHKAYERLLSAYERHQVNPVLLARALREGMREKGIPDFVKSEKIYQQELKFYK